MAESFGALAVLRPRAGGDAHEPTIDAMKDLRTLLLSAAASFAAAVPAQEPETAAPAKPPVAAPAPKKTVEQLIEALGSESYRARLDAERALRELGNEALPGLQKAAENSADAEVQWRARRVLRQIERGGSGDLETRKRDTEPPVVEGTPQEPQKVLRRRGQGQDPMRDQFESLFERLNQDFGLDIPRARFFDDRFFRDLQEQLKDGSSHSQGMSMQVGPDGKVRVEVQEKGEDGKSETKVYEAPDMETFQKQYPNVLRQNGLGMGLFQFPGGGNEPQWFGGQPLRSFGWNGRGLVPIPAPGPRQGQGQAQGQDDIELMDPADAAPPAPPAGKRLGVAIQKEIPAGVREYLELEEGVGLQIESVSPDSLAAALGLRKGDIVTHIGKHTIGSPQDVQDALGPIDKGAEVEVQFVRKGQHMTAKAEKTEATAAPVEANEKANGKPGSGRLQRRSGKTGESIR